MTKELTKEVKTLLDTEVRRAIHETLDTKGLSRPVQEKPKSLTEAPKPKMVQRVKEAARSLQEAIVLLPRAFLIKTDKLSDRAKQAHDILYKAAVEAFNKISIGLDASNTDEAKSTTSAFRSLKVDQTDNLNSIKLHELFFTNISDMASEVSIDSAPFMRLSRDFGTFERWQQDFIACAMSARNGWAITVFEPYRNVYMNVCVDGHTKGMPVGVVPVIVLDMWEHAYFKDYADDKKTYIHSMMRELNWSVIEARMTVAERASLQTLYQIQPVVNDAPEAMLSAADKAASVPIQNIKPGQGTQTQQLPKGGTGPLAATAPPSPATQAGGVLQR